MWELKKKTETGKMQKRKRSDTIEAFLTAQFSQKHLIPGFGYLIPSYIQCNKYSLVQCQENL
jgi:hypothetical protein